MSPHFVIVTGLLKKATCSLALFMKYVKMERYLKIWIRVVLLNTKKMKAKMLRKWMHKNVLFMRS